MWRLCKQGETIETLCLDTPCKETSFSVQTSSPTASLNSPCSKTLNGSPAIFELPPPFLSFSTIPSDSMENKSLSRCSHEPILQLFYRKT
mmetsp:Transcript_30589/g.69052  ORF Transcript_30589/g.69052 Transcript_30589/m.69052 type:complete len:90 (+) Transcript_30589:913-1182(+)